MLMKFSLPWRRTPHELKIQQKQQFSLVCLKRSSTLRTRNFLLCCKEPDEFIHV
jgi:hypothetical protein